MMARLQYEAIFLHIYCFTFHVSKNHRHVRVHGHINCKPTRVNKKCCKPLFAIRFQPFRRIRNMSKLQDHMPTQQEHAPAPLENHHGQTSCSQPVLVHNFLLPQLFTPSKKANPTTNHTGKSYSYHRWFAFIVLIASSMTKTILFLRAGFPCLLVLGSCYFECNFLLLLLLTAALLLPHHVFASL